MPTHFHLRGTGTDLGDEVTYRYMSEAVIDQLQFDYPASCEVVPCACAGGEFVLDHEERGERERVEVESNEGAARAAGG